MWGAVGRALLALGRVEDQLPRVPLVVGDVMVVELHVGDVPPVRVVHVASGAQGARGSGRSTAGAAGVCADQKRPM